MNDLLDVLGRPIHLFGHLRGWYCIDDIKEGLNECVIYIELKPFLIYKQEGLVAMIYTNCGRIFRYVLQRVLTSREKLMLWK